MRLINGLHGFILVSLLVLNGCNKRLCKNSRADNSTGTVLDLHHMPKQAPQDLQPRLAWGLWHLDPYTIKASLDAGANPYTLALSVKGLKAPLQKKELSAYALAIEGYLNSTYLEDNLENIYNALDRLYGCLDFLIRNKISIDYGVTTLESNLSMREFVCASASRLNEEKLSKGMLDDEGEYALRILDRLQILINEYQPK